MWANFTIPESDSALLDSQKLIIYQVDDYPPQTQDSNRFGERAMHMHLIDAQPKWVNWAIGARKSTGLQQTLRQLQGGQRLIVRFYLITGGSRDTEFTLAGAREALAEVAGFPATWDVAVEQRAKEQLKEQLKRRPLINAAASGAFQRCKARFSQRRALDACNERGSNCTRKYGDDPISPEAVAALIACYDAVRP